MRSSEVPLISLCLMSVNFCDHSNVKVARNLLYGNLRNMSTDKWAVSKSAHTTSLQILGQLLFLLENAQKLNFEAPPTLCPHHQQTYRQVKKLLMNLLWHAVNSMLQVKTLCHTEKEGFGYRWFSKKVQNDKLLIVVWLLSV